MSELRISDEARATLVAFIKDTNDDEPGFDEASAEAAVDALLMDLTAQEMEVLIVQAQRWLRFGHA